MDSISLSTSFLEFQKDLALVSEKQQITIEALHQIKAEILVEQKRQLEECFSRKALWSAAQGDVIDPLPLVELKSHQAVDSVDDPARQLSRSSDSSPVESRPRKERRNSLSRDSLYERSQRRRQLGRDSSYEDSEDRNCNSETACSSVSSKRFNQEIIAQKTNVAGERCSVVHDEGNLLRRKWRCKECVKHPSFDGLCAVVIIFNAILIGVETEFLAQVGSSPNLIDILQLLLNIWYLIELLLRLVTFRSGFWTGEDQGWNVFDSILVASAFTDLFLANVSTGSSARILRVLRLLRIVRTLRIMRSLKYVREFRKMVYSLVASAQTLIWALLLVIAVVYGFSLFFTQSAAYTRDHGDLSQAQLQNLSRYYSSCSRTMYSLFAAISGGYSWHVLLDVWIAADSPFTSALFVLYISVAVFGLLNIVTSVFVESAMQATKHFQDLLVDARQKDMEMNTYHMKKIFAQMDTDGGGTINFQEMKIVLSDTEWELPQYLEALGISSADVWVLFKLLDDDGSGVIDIDEFCDGCMRLKGEAKSFDINCMIYESRAMVKYQAEFMNFVEDWFEALDAKNDAMIMEVDKRVAVRLISLLPKQMFTEGTSHLPKMSIEGGRSHSPRVNKPETPRFPSDLPPSDFNPLVVCGSLPPRRRRHRSKRKDEQAT